LGHLKILTQLMIGQVKLVASVLIDTNSILEMVVELNTSIWIVKMSFDVKLLKDSISAERKRLRTFQLRYPRFIHSELMTHRVFSRNASSSRAIPVKRMIEDILADPAMPIHWGANQPGMQAHHELNDETKPWVQYEWSCALHDAVKTAQRMHDLGAHKQIVNRILEPFMHINVVLTATDLANWYALRRDADAQPEIKHLAELMWSAQECSVPTLLQPGEWHLPYITNDDWAAFPQDLIEGGDGYSYDEALENLIKISVARCARVSYTLHDGSSSTIEKDIELHDKLLVAVPLHASPAEHQATPDVMGQGHQGPYGEWIPARWKTPYQHGNLSGWIQYRKTLKNEWVPG
jgi:thymidylate synthase ThyX